MICASILLLCSCGVGNKKVVESAQVIADSIPAEPSADLLEIPITNLGIEEVKCGMRVNSLTPSMANLYDSIAIEQDLDHTTYQFMLDGRPRFTGYEFGDGLIDALAAADSSVYVDTPDGHLTLGMPFSRLLKLKDATAEYQALDDNGMWSWRWQGLYFLPSQQNLPQRLSSKLYNQATTPDAADFDDNVVIDYIGTGLPY